MTCETLTDGNNIAENNSNRRSAYSFAVVIPTKNRPQDLKVVVAGVLAQTVLPRQLIIVDQSESDESEKLIKAYFGECGAVCRRSIELEYVRDNTIRGLTAARNRALQVVKNDIVLFLDDDVVLDSDFIRYVAETYGQFPSVTGVSGIITNYVRPPWIYRAWTSLFARGTFHDDRQPLYWGASSVPKGRPLRVTRLGGGLMSFRVTAIARAKFDENLSGACEGEDVDFCLQLGRNAVLLIQPKAQLVHKQTSTARISRDWLYLNARTSWYLYRRGYARGPHGLACFVWLNVGQIIATALVSIRRLSLVPWILSIQAVEDSRSLASNNTAFVTADGQALSH